MLVKIEEIVIPEERARSRWSPEQKAMLEGAVKEYGQLSDPLVRRLPDGSLELLDGESRLREFMAAGIEECEVKVVDLNDKDASLVNVMMNIARGSQDPMGIALAFSKAIKEGHTEEKIAQATGHSREWVRFHIDLNILPEVYQDALRTEEIKVGHVRQAFRLPTPAEQTACLNLAITHKYKVNVIENYVDNIMAEYEANRILQEYITVVDTTPRVDPQRLIHTTRCLACNEQKPSGEICHPVICEECYALLRAIVPTIGCGSEGIQRFNDMLNLYRQYVQDAQRAEAPPQPAPITPPQPSPQVPSATEIVADDSTITKPPGMPVEEWENLKQALKIRHS